MVVLLAIGLVVDDVEVRGGEGLVAGAAGEALLVPAAGEAAVGCFDGLAFDGLVAAAAAWFDAASCGTPDGSWTGLGLGARSLWRCWQRLLRWVRRVRTSVRRPRSAKRISWRC